MDSELLFKCIEYFPDYLSALSRTLLRFFGQPLSKKLYKPYYSARQVTSEYPVGEEMDKGPDKPTCKLMVVIGLLYF